MTKEPYIYLHSRNNKRYRYSVNSRLFEYSEHAKRTLINSIYCKQWATFKPIDSYLSYALIESLKLELLTKQGYL